MINFEWYRSFVAIYQVGTITAAAQKRCLTQPTLSQHIAALESALNTRLFERTSRKMIPTPAARMLYPQVIASVERLDNIGRRSLSANRARWVRIGSPITFFQEVVLERLQPLKQQKILVDVHFGESNKLIESLSKGKLDVVISTKKFPLPRIHFIMLQAEYFAIIGDTGTIMPKSSRRSLGAVEKWLAKRNWIAFDSDLPIIRRYWQQVFSKRPEFHPAMIIPDLHGIVRAVECGYGLSVIPYYLLDNDRVKYAVEEVWTAKCRVSNHIFIACHLDRLQDPIIESVINVLLPSAETNIQ
jgi:DNA-binding transcriptional LysR family regulator